MNSDIEYGGLKSVHDTISEANSKNTELSRLTALVAEQQRRIAELEKERDAALGNADDNYKKYQLAVSRSNAWRHNAEAIQSSARQMKEALEELTAACEKEFIHEDPIARERYEQPERSVMHGGSGGNHLLYRHIYAALAAVQSAASLDLGSDFNRAKGGGDDKGD